MFYLPELGQISMGKISELDLWGASEKCRDVHDVHGPDDSDHHVQCEDHVQWSPTSVPGRVQGTPARLGLEVCLVDTQNGSAQNGVGRLLA